ncbi:MAG: sulfite exporter TauE/SafE family protein [Acidobacteriota bacterium]
MTDYQLLIPVFIFLVAALYASVGHGGASGYLAVMGLLSVPSIVSRPSALFLNLFVASIAAFKYHQAGFFDRKLFIKFAALSIPMAFVGGRIQISPDTYRLALGAVLLVAALRLAFDLKESNKHFAAKWIPALFIGGTIGLLSGMVGVGGGIFLTPLLVLFGWSDMKNAAGISAMFILVNSAAALASKPTDLLSLPTDSVFWVASAVTGGILGASLGSRRLSTLTMRRILASVLIFAAIKMIAF